MYFENKHGKVLSSDDINNLSVLEIEEDMIHVSEKFEFDEYN
jgi:hypothetical protein